MKYGLVFENAIVRLYFEVFRSMPTVWPLPAKLACWIDAVKVNFSACENEPPIMKLPVGFSSTVRLTSTWSAVPGDSGVSTLTSLK